MADCYQAADVIIYDGDASGDWVFGGPERSIRGLVGRAIVWVGFCNRNYLLSGGAALFDSFEEPYARLLAYAWGYFGAALVWVLGHWLLFYGVIAQPTVLLIALGYGLAALYYLDHFDKLSVAIRRQFLFIMFATVAIMLVALLKGSNKIV